MPNYQNFYHIKNSINRCGRRLSEVAVPFYNIVGGSRISSKMRYVCTDEVIYDSFVPRIDEILEVEGSYPRYQTFRVSGSSDNSYSSVGIYLLSSQPATWYLTSTPNTPTKNPRYSTWFKSFPFEGRYSNLNRSLPPTSYKSYTFSGNVINVNNITFEITTDVEPTTNTEAKVRNILYDELFETSSSLGSLGSQVVPPPNNELYKFFFGIGNEKSAITGSTGNVIQSFVDLPTFFRKDVATTIKSNRGDSYPDTLYSVCGVSISGWKYGIYNALPTSTTCVFRRNSYGQFRDMLEQRPFTVFFDQAANKPLAGPVEVKFVKLVQSGTTENRIGSYVSADPYQVDTLNKSTFATSSIPYFDY